MEQLDIQQTPSTPFISFDATTTVIIISGESFPENSFAFYAPVITWLKQYLQQHEKLTLNITVSYMNSSSIKCMLDLLDIMEEASNRGAGVEIFWHYDRENPRSFELAEEFQEEVSFPFAILELGP